MKRNDKNKSGRRKSGHRISIHDRNGSTSWEEGLVEKLPVEVVGEILSQLGVARDVIRASLTCRKWREAYLKHLHTLSFDVADDDRVYRELPISDLEMLMTETLYQSPGLRRLSILMDDKHDFTASTVVGWLMFARKNLTELFFKVRTSNPINVLAIFGRQRLETLSLRDYVIDGVEPEFKPFPCLTSLSLSRVRISVEGLNRLLLAFPRLKRAELCDIFLWALSDDDHSPEIRVKLSCPTLKTVSLSYLQPMDLILENGGMEYLHVQRCCFGTFKVKGSKSLRHFNMSYAKVQVLKIEDGDNLESLEIISSDVTESNLFPMKISTPQLKTFRIWGTNIFVRGKGQEVDLQRLAVCSPQLGHLAMFFYEEPSCNCTLGSLEKVGMLEIGWEWDYIDGFCQWVEKLLKCCPNVGKLTVHGIVPKEALLPCPSEFLEEFGGYTSSMLEIMKKYQQIQVQFVYKYQGGFSAYT